MKTEWPILKVDSFAVEYKLKFNIVSNNVCKGMVPWTQTSGKRTLDSYSDDPLFLEVNKSRMHRLSICDP